MDSGADGGDVLSSETRQTRTTMTAAMAGVHVLLWGGLILGLAFPAARFLVVFEDFGVELSTGQQVMLDVSNAAATTWYLAVPVVLALGWVDWLVLRSLDTPDRRMLARLWFWALVVVPFLLTLLAALQISLGYIGVFRNLS